MLLWAQVCCHWNYKVKIEFVKPNDSVWWCVAWLATENRCWLNSNLGILGFNPVYLGLWTMEYCNSIPFKCLLPPSLPVSAYLICNNILNLLLQRCFIIWLYLVALIWFSQVIVNIQKHGRDLVTAHSWLLAIIPQNEHQFHAKYAKFRKYAVDEY